MGKQNNTEDKLTNIFIFILVIAGIIWLIFGLAVIVAPVVVLILFLVNLIRYLIHDKKKRATNFWLSVQEQEQYEKSAYILAHAAEEKEKIQELITVQGISRNQDGQISQRSYAGKELRERENAAKSLINQYTPIYNDLRFKPYRSWKKARSHYSNIFGFGCILLVLALPILIGISTPKDISESEPSVSTLQSETVDSTKIVAQPQKSEQKEQIEQKETSANDSDEFLSGLLSFFGISIGIMAGILGVLAVIWFIGWLVGRIKFGLKNPEPPLVDIDNVDTYIEKYVAKRTQKETERQQRKEKRKEKRKQKRDQKRIAKELAKEDKIRCAETKLKESETQKFVAETTSDTPVAESDHTASVPQGNDTRPRSKEENLFISWADILRNDGYDITGNWENWENAGSWKNLAIISSINGVGIRIIIEYYEKSRKIYFGIANNNGEKVSQELLNSDTFQNIIRENGLTVKNNESWYCLKFSTFSKIFQEYQHLIETIK